MKIISKGKAYITNLLYWGEVKKLEGNLERNYKNVS